MGGTPLHEYEMADYDRIFSLNSVGVFAGMKYGAEAIFKSKSEGGFLINVASVAGLMPQSGQALYTATKFGVIGMTRVAAMDYAKYGITVNAICPGCTRTSIFGDAADAAMSFFEKDCPSGRMGDPRECAYLTLFLASDMARYISGAAIPVDGALSPGHKSVTTWKHPELITGEALSSRSTIAAIMEDSKGDDALLMCGRCQDFGTYRCEKELDVCDWDIVGSELCRTTTTIRAIMMWNGPRSPRIWKPVIPYQSRCLMIIDAGP